MGFEVGYCDADPRRAERSPVLGWPRESGSLLFFFFPLPLGFKNFSFSFPLPPTSSLLFYNFSCGFEFSGLEMPRWISSFSPAIQ